MARHRTFHSPEFKKKILERVFAGESVTAIAKQHGLKTALIYRWKTRSGQKSASIATKPNQPANLGTSAQDEIHRLKLIIGDLMVENHKLKHRR